MPKIALTDAFVRGSKCITGELVEWADTRERGLSLRVTAAGVKSWTFRYRDAAGNRKRISLGRVDDVPLADARIAAGAERGKIHQGVDPSVERRSRKATAAKEAANTIEAVGGRYFELAPLGRHKQSGRPKKQRTLDDERSYFDRLIIPELGPDRLSDLTRYRLQEFIDEVGDEHSPGAARNCRVVLQAIYAFANWQDIVSVNPCQYVAAPKVSARETVMTDEQLSALWRGCDTAHQVDDPDFTVSRSVALSIMVAAATLQRRGEVTGMMMSELDLDRALWTIPGTRTKNGRTHVVPLSPLALKLIREAIALAGDRDEVFPSPRDKTRAILPAALTRAFRRVCAQYKIVGVRPHDLRRTGATNLTSERIGVSRFVVSKVLNHSSDAGDGAAVTAVYDRNAYLPEKRKALDSWADLLQGIVSAEPA